MNDFVLEYRLPCGELAIQEVTFLDALVTFGLASIGEGGSDESGTDEMMRRSVKKEGGLRGEMLVMALMYANMNVKAMLLQEWAAVMGVTGDGMNGSLTKEGAPVSYVSLLAGPQEALAGLGWRTDGFWWDEEKLRWGDERSVHVSAGLRTVVFESRYEGGAVADGCRILTAVTTTRGLADAVVSSVYRRSVTDSWGLTA